MRLNLGIPHHSKGRSNLKNSMKTTKISFLKVLSGFAAVCMIFLASCTEDVEFSENDSQSVENEAATDGYFEDADDMSALAVSAEGATLSGSRESSSGRAGVKPADIRFNDCVSVTLELAGDNTTAIPHGYITVDFGTGCEDARGNVRKGKIKIEFIGKRFFPGSKIITTFEEYSINGVKIEGTRTVTNVTESTESSPKFSIVLTGGKATWPDNTTATREVNRTREWVRASNPLQDQWIVDGTASGTNRNGDVYQVDITTPLVYKRECAITNRVFMAVQGVKVLTVGTGRTITIDYGSGECDRVVTVTINGQSKTITVRGEI